MAWSSSIPSRVVRRTPGRCSDNHASCPEEVLEANATRSLAALSSRATFLPQLPRPMMPVLTLGGMAQGCLTSRTVGQECCALGSLRRRGNPHLVDHRIALHRTDLTRDGDLQLLGRRV